MKDKYKFDLSEEEKIIIVKALNLFRNNLIAQDRPFEAIDDILLKINEKNKLELDLVDTNIIINSLNNYRHKLKSENQPRTEVNSILSKMIEETDKKKLTLRITLKDNAR